MLVYKKGTILKDYSILGLYLIECMCKNYNVIIQILYIGKYYI